MSTSNRMSFVDFAERLEKSGVRIRITSIVSLTHCIVIFGQDLTTPAGYDAVAIYDKVTGNVTRHVDVMTVHGLINAYISKVDRCEEEDEDMTAEDLIGKYGAHGRHPNHPRDLWFAEVATRETQLGYWAWVESRLSSGRE